MLLGALVCGLVLLLAYPVSEYLDQHRQIADLRQDIADKKASVAALAEQKLRWEDPAYVEQQARGRLNYVMPGDTVYIVVGPNDTADPAPPPPPPADSATPPDSWYDGLRESIEDADDG